MPTRRNVAIARRNLIGLARREAGGDDGDLHRLFLKQRHAQRLAEHRLQFLRGKGDLLQPLAATQIGMHHVALDRPRTHDRDLDDEIVEFFRLQPRQHRHLRAALDLEHADRVGALDHLIDASLLGRNGAERQRQSVVLVEEIQALAQRRQHAEREHVDLQYAERVEIVLVPFDGGAILHRRVHDRRDFVEPVARDDEAAAVLGQMAREAGEFVGDLKRQRQSWIVGSRPADRARSIPIGATPPQLVLLSATMTSSESPKTFAVSRIAERVR